MASRAMLLMLVETVGGVSRENGFWQKRWRRTRLSRLPVTVGVSVLNQPRLKKRIMLLSKLGAAWFSKHVKNLNCQSCPWSRWLNLLGRDKRLKPKPLRRAKYPRCLLQPISTTRRWYHHMAAREGKHYRRMGNERHSRQKNTSRRLGLGGKWMLSHIRWSRLTSKRQGDWMANH